MRKIGIFPLNIVLFPESVFPLHIFEERYKELINESINNDEEFGINLLNNQKMFEVGCTAKVTKVIKRYDDGKLDINVTGIQRYRLDKFNDGERAFYVGEVDHIFDKDELLDEMNLIEAVDLFNEVARQIKIIKIDELTIDDLKTQTPSFTIAQKSGLSPVQKQEILEMTSENNRLSYLRRHLKQIIPAINEANQVEQIVKNDGYIKPNLLK